MAALDPDKTLLLLCKVLSPHLNKKLWKKPPPEGKPVKGAADIEIAADLAEMGKTPEGRRELSLIRDEICDRIRDEEKFNCTLGVAVLQDGSFGTTLGDLRDYIIAISVPL
jgi:hypothetical protein